MGTLVGLIVDVSGSMLQNISTNGIIDEERKTWAHEVFNFVDSIIKNDLSTNEQVFAIGVGASCGKGVFDIINTIDQVQSLPRCDAPKPVLIEYILELLKTNGAKDIRRWAQNEMITACISHDMAKLMYSKLKNDPEFLKKVVNDVLPWQCRNWGGSAFPTLGVPISELAVKILRVTGKLGKDAAQEEDVVQAMEEVKSLLLKKVDSDSIVGVCKASEILHGCADGEELSEQRIDELMRFIDPFIYGRSPLNKGIRKASRLFNTPAYRNHKKVLVILSDGEPTDIDGFFLKELQARNRLKSLGVCIVCCFISQNNLPDPKRLYSVLQNNWPKHARFLFQLSSAVQTQCLPRTVLLKQGWTIDIENNETKLFFQVNHPSITEDVTKLVKNLVFSQDALADILSSVSLDILVNQHCENFKAQERQNGGTCYAHATAAVFYLATRRILGREGEANIPFTIPYYPDFTEMRDKLVDRFGRQGAIPREVLEYACPIYRLRYKFLGGDVIKALCAITAKRPVLAIFFLTNDEWDMFSDFFRNNPQGVLTSADLPPRAPAATRSGHAVVLVSYNVDGLKFMNSWGDNWGDTGFFRVQDAKVLDLEFFDIFWTVEDLTDWEKNYYRNHGHKNATELITSLNGFQHLQYECPRCEQMSFVSDFSGTTSNAQCPKCRESFPTTDAGNLLSLSMYLISLSR